MKYCITICLYLGVLYATLIHVPDDYPAIQSGIDASADGDTVLVLPGTYFESINFNGHNVILGSMFILTGDTNAITQTIIDAQGNGSVVVMAGGENSTLSGFTITHGSAASSGGGIDCRNSDPVLDHLVVANNFAGEICAWDGAGAGGGLFALSSTIQISHVIITGNNTCGGWGSGGAGGGVYLHDSYAVMDHVTFVGNNTGAGGALYAHNSELAMANCTIMDNETFGYVPQGSEAIYSTGSQILCSNTIIRGSGNQGLTLASGWELPSNTLSISYSNIMNGFDSIIHEEEDIVQWLDGNIDLDPLFMNTGFTDYSLQVDSPCIDTGHPDLDGDGISWENDPDDRDPDGTRFDMGAFYYDQADCSQYDFEDCDGNGDGESNILDIVLAILMIMGDEPMTPYLVCIYDSSSNQDGVLDILDIVYHICCGCWWYGEG